MKQWSSSGDRRRRRIFLAVLSAAIFFLFIVLPFWLLYRRSVTPPSPEAFGPAAPTETVKPEPMPEPADTEEEGEVKFR